ncbi:hypothetical protein [Deinococcus pimensis]|uniref:hypothetical protein n=1 Tax=Deinococcus pimensis TaxID=309888 RepID=UPI000480F605|nr:hypothetical protein [Deinococcus pimensis]
MSEEAMTPERARALRETAERGMQENALEGRRVLTFAPLSHVRDLAAAYLAKCEELDLALHYMPRGILQDFEDALARRRAGEDE